MPLHVVLPGLLWPRDTVAEIARNLELPALATLLGRASVAWQSAIPFEHWISAQFGLSADEPPCAALRLRGEGLDPGGRTWLCVDPAHVRYARDTLMVGAPDDLDLTQADADRLVAELNEHMGGLGEFRAPHPQRWYLGLDHAPRIRTRPLSMAFRRPLEQFMPDGPDARDWRRILNEAQTLLHNHPVNAEREAAGKAPANSLLLWGTGALPGAARQAAAAIYAGSPLTRGLAQLARLPCHEVPPSYTGMTEGIIVHEGLAGAAHAGNPSAWRDGLCALERRWFGPLLAALKSGRLRHLRVTVLGDEGIADLALQPTRVWRFWRAPRPLGSFVPPLSDDPR